MLNMEQQPKKILTWSEIVIDEDNAIQSLEQSLIIHKAIKAEAQKHV